MTSGAVKQDKKDMINILGIGFLPTYLVGDAVDGGYKKFVRPIVDKIQGVRQNRRTRNLEGRSKSSGDLEKIAEGGDVSLSEKEREEISDISKKYSGGLGALVGAGAMTTALYGGIFNNDYLAWGGLLGLVVGTPSLAVSSDSLFKKFLTNRALKQKRKALGLPAKDKKPEMEVIEEFNFHESTKIMKELLSQVGLEKRFGRKFVNENGDVEVIYRDASRYTSRNNFGWPISDFPETNVKVRAPKREIAEPVLSLIESLLIAPEKIRGGGTGARGA